jgi:ankyrin repeat protein
MLASGRSALMLSSFCGHVDVVRTIFETTKLKELLFDVDNDGWTALFYAASMGHDQVVERKE